MNKRGYLLLAGIILLAGFSVVNSCSSQMYTGTPHAESMVYGANLLWAIGFGFIVLVFVFARRR